jgi:predicted O-methyltransferase YrrM
MLGSYGMTPIVPTALEAYIHDLVPQRDDVLREIEERAVHYDIPIIGPVVGTLLSQLAKSIHAKRIFELGSAVGYSTLWLAKAVPAGGKVYYTDGSEENAKDARSYFQRAGLLDRVEIRVGDALTQFNSVDGDFDLIFNDIDKRGYPDVYRYAAGRVRVGGYLVTDNTLWSGRVIDSNNNDIDTLGVREFNQRLCADPRFETTVLSVRDGVTVALRVR